MKMSNVMTVFLVVLGMLAVLPAHSEVPYLIGRGTNYQYFTWDTTCPTGCPFSASSYRRLQFTGRWATYTAADTFYPTWGADDVLYTPWTDGSIGDYGTASPNPGQCKAEGGDPLYLDHRHPVECRVRRRRRAWALPVRLVDVQRYMVL